MFLALFSNRQSSHFEHVRCLEKIAVHDILMWYEVHFSHDEFLEICPDGWHRYLERVFIVARIRRYRSCREKMMNFTKSKNCDRFKETSLAHQNHRYS